eukprot:TRINITY_DN6918_c0_g1_i3.p1 TRINITY_DN6918_c0_g1~~TRINITY_DN6918_c0_g1_i3.p1  ORF type:complete len:526 (+),score=208.63 TRINITY_DN6918_c0_g1_i3:45-1622(+)
MLATKFSTLKLNKSLSNYLFAFPLRQQFKISFSSQTQTIQQQHEKQEKQLKPFSSIPSPPSFWLIGQLPTVLKFPNQQQKQQEFIFEKYGEIVRLQLFGQDYVYLFDPSDIADIFRTNSKYPRRTIIEPWTMYRKERNLPLGIVSSHGEDWRRHRQVLNKMLLPPVIETYVPRVSQVAQEFVQTIKNSINKDYKLEQTKDIIFNYSTEAVLRVLIGRKLNLLNTNKKRSDDMDILIKSVVKMFETTEKMIFSLQLWRYFNTPLKKQNFAATDNIFKVASKLMQESGIGTGIKSSEIDPNDFINDGIENFLEHIIHSEDKLSNEEIKAACVDMIGAGVDTTTNALMSTLYHIAQESEIQEKLYNELMELVKQGKSDAELESHPFLKNIVTESLRLNPIVALNSRFFDFDIAIKGYHIPANTYLVLANWVPGRSEKYFKDALKFNPDRHVNKQHHPFAALTFGSGARSCVGKRLALMEIQTALMYLVLNFKIENKGNFPNIISKMLLSPIIDDSTKLYFYPRQNQFN